MRSLQSLAAVLFSAAGAVLAFGVHGPLTWPGMATALVGGICVLTGRNMLAVAAGAMAATISFGAQAVYGICGSCMWGAALFGFAGIVSAVPVLRRKPGAVALLMLPLAVAGGLVCCRIPPVGVDVMVGSTSAGTANGSPLAAEQSAVTVGYVPTSELQVDQNPVPRLYFSPWCDACTDALADFVEYDPLGDKWQPVVTPQHAGLAGEEVLAGLGYKGPVATASRPPGQAVPCLEVDGRVMMGSGRIIGYLENNMGE